MKTIKLFPAMKIRIKTDSISKKRMISRDSVPLEIVDAVAGKEFEASSSALVPCDFVIVLEQAGTTLRFNIAPDCVEILKEAA